VGAYASNLFRGLSELDCEIAPLLHRAVDPSFRCEPETLNIGGVGKLASAWVPVNKTVWMQTMLPWGVRRRRLDVCHFTNGVAPLRLACPIVVTIHDTGLWRYPQFHYWKRILSMRPVVSRVARRAAAVITVSESVKKEVVELLGVRPERVHVVYSGVGSHFRRLESDAVGEAVRRQHNLPERFVLVVGSIEPRKNLVRLLRAYARLRQRPSLRDVGLVFVGELGWKYEPILEEARLLGDAPVRFVGRVDDASLVAMYNLASVLAFPSIYEGFGLPILEAMACGTPVLTSNSGAMAEVAGDAAELVDPLSEESIARGLRSVLDDVTHAAKLRRRGLVRAQSFSWVDTATRTLRVYTQALQE